jgi:hypothetical protein
MPDAAPTVMDATIDAISDAMPLDADAMSPPRDPSAIGPFTVENLSARVPTRSFPDVGVELFVPEGLGEIPLVMFTTGIFVGLDGYRGLGTYLASHGFAVGFPVQICGVVNCQIQALANQTVEVAESLVSVADFGSGVSSVGYMGHGVGASIAMTAASNGSGGAAVLALLPNNLSDPRSAGFNVNYPDLRERVPSLGPTGLLGARGGVNCISSERDSDRLVPFVLDLPQHVYWRWQESGVTWVDVLSEPLACDDLCERVCLSPSEQYTEFHQSVKTFMVAFFAQALLGEDMEAWLNPDEDSILSRFGWIASGSEG